jgi:hypothetical protein
MKSISRHAEFFEFYLLYVLTKIKSEKSTFMLKSPEKKPYRQTLLSEKQIKFKEFCVS